MDDFIQRSDALKVIKTANSMVFGLLEATIKLCVTMDRIAAADVAPVRHGRWEWYDSFSYRCSSCEKYWIAPGDQYDYHYCPNCGADMREEQT